MIEETITTITLQITGPLAELDRFEPRQGQCYHKGIMTLHGSPGDLAKIAKYHARCYEAKPTTASLKQNPDGEPRIHVRLVLTGPMAGQDFDTKRGYVFKKGVLDLEDSPENLEGIIKYLSRCYEAVPEDTLKARSAPDMSEIAKALRKEAASGERDIQEEGIEDRQPEVQREVQPVLEGPAEEQAGVVLESGFGEAGSPGIQAEGDSGRARLLEVIHGLDPADDTHWTKSGRPSVFALRALTGDVTITAKDIDDAAPGLVRKE